MGEAAIYHLYVLLCDHQVLYTGIAINPADRLIQHQSGAPHGAKFTRRFKTLELIYQTPVGTRSAAQSIEIHFKKLSKQAKLEVVKTQLNTTQLYEYLSMAVK